MMYVALRRRESSVSSFINKRNNSSTRSVRDLATLRKREENKAR